MKHNSAFANMDIALPRMLQELNTWGEEMTSRAGVVKEMMHVGITLGRPWQRELLVPHRKPNLAAQIAETMWVLAGRNDVEFLSHYLPRAADFSDDGETWRGGYGPRLRSWAGGSRFTEDGELDQLAHVVNLLRKDPATRQAVISIYDPAVDTTPGKDIPCNNWLSFSSRLGYLDLHVAVRSNDAMWGWSGINAFEWSALQEVVAAMIGNKVGALHFSTTSFHLYDRHWSKAQNIATATKPKDPGLADSPRCSLNTSTGIRDLDSLLARWFAIEAQIRMGTVPMAEVRSAIDGFPETMMRSWLRVIAWWWTNSLTWLDQIDPLERTRLEVAARDYAIQPPTRVPSKTQQAQGDCSEFLGEVMALHRAKDAAYGDSWKKRGESFSIIPNIARKVDRLGNGETDDENQADTAIDLLVYLAKYRVWLTSAYPGARMAGFVTLNSDGTEDVHTLLQMVENEMEFTPHPPHSRPSVIIAQQNDLKRDFETLVLRVQHQDTRHENVDAMLKVAYRLAYNRWADVRDNKPGDDYNGADAD